MDKNTVVFFILNLRLNQNPLAWDKLRTPRHRPELKKRSFIYNCPINLPLALVRTNCKCRSDFREFAVPENRYIPRWADTKISMISARWWKRGHWTLKSRAAVVIWVSLVRPSVVLSQVYQKPLHALGPNFTRRDFLGPIPNFHPFRSTATVFKILHILGFSHWLPC